MKAKIYKENELFDQAIEYANRAISLAPDKNEYYIFIADLYYLTKKFSDAEKYYKEAVMYDPTSVYAKYRAALCSQKNGDYKEAAAYYSMASRLSPSSTDISFDYADCLCRSKEYKAALQVLKKALEFSDSEEKTRQIMEKSSHIKRLIDEQLVGFNKLISSFKKKNEKNK